MTDERSSTGPQGLNEETAVDKSILTNDTSKIAETTKTPNAVSSVLVKIRDAFAYFDLWIKQIPKTLILLIGLVLLSVFDFRTDTEADPKVPEGSEVTLFALPEPDWKNVFPKYDEQTLASMHTQLQNFWKLPSLPSNQQIIPVLIISFVRSGQVYQRGTVVAKTSNDETVATITPKMNLRGPTEINIRPVFSDDENHMRTHLIRAYGLKMDGRRIPFDPSVDYKTGMGVFRLTTIPPPGLSRLVYNLDKAWRLFF